MQNVGPLSIEVQAFVMIVSMTQTKEEQIILMFQTCPTGVDYEIVTMTVTTVRQDLSQKT